MKLKTEEHFLMEEVYDKLDRELADSIDSFNRAVSIKSEAYNYEYAIEIIEWIYIKTKIHSAICSCEISNHIIKELHRISLKHNVLDTLAYLIKYTLKNVDINNDIKLIDSIENSISILSLIREYNDK